MYKKKNIITNTYATFLSLATDMGLKSIKEKFNRIIIKNFHRL